VWGKGGVRPWREKELVGEGGLLDLFARDGEAFSGVRSRTAHTMPAAIQPRVFSGVGNRTGWLRVLSLASALNATLTGRHCRAARRVH
jgi:hypothetical protein